LFGGKLFELKRIYLKSKLKIPFETWVTARSSRNKDKSKKHYFGENLNTYGISY